MGASDRFRLVNAARKGRAASLLPGKRHVPGQGSSGDAHSGSHTHIKGLYLWPVTDHARRPIDPAGPRPGISKRRQYGKHPNRAMQIEHYLGFHKGDEVLDAAELTAGTARIKEIHLAFDDMGVTAIAVMENGAERFVTQLKKVRRSLPESKPNNIVGLRG